MVVKISDFVEIKFIGIYAPVERQARGGERNRQTDRERGRDRKRFWAVACVRKPITFIAMINGCSNMLGKAVATLQAYTQRKWVIQKLSVRTSCRIRQCGASRIKWLLTMLPLLRSFSRLTSLHSCSHTRLFTMRPGERQQYLSSVCC